MMKSAWALRYLLEKPCLLQKLPVFERPQGLEMSHGPEEPHSLETIRAGES